MNSEYMDTENVDLKKRLSNIEKHLYHLYQLLVKRSLQEAQRVDEKFMTIEEAADYINKSVHTLYRYTSKNTVPHYKQGGKVYFLRDELESWVKSGKPKTEEELKEEAKYSLKVRTK